MSLTSWNNKTGNVRIAFVQPPLQWKNNKYYIFPVCVCSLRYPACNAHAPYCHLWPLWLYCIFPYYLIDSTIFEKKYILLNLKKCVHFLYIFCPKVSIVRRIKRGMIKYVYVGLHSKYPLFLSVLMKLESSRQISKKILRYQISRKSIQWEWELRCCTRTDTWRI